MQTGEEEELFEVNREEDAEDKHPGDGGGGGRGGGRNLPLRMRSLQSHWAATAIGVN